MENDIVTQSLADGCKIVDLEEELRKVRAVLGSVMVVFINHPADYSETEILVSSIARHIDLPPDKVRTILKEAHQIALLS